MLVIQEKAPSSEPEIILTDWAAFVSWKGDSDNVARTESKMASQAVALTILKHKNLVVSFLYNYPMNI